MSLKMKISKKDLDEICAEFRSMIEGSGLPGGKIRYEKDIGHIDRKATLWFTEQAYLKMLGLVQSFDTEVGWHGIAERNGEGSYIVSDIIVYPQQVTGATVVTDQEEYQDWLMNRDNDEFEKVRMHGHSHVRMSVTPSSVDLKLYNGIVSQMEDDMFYIFLITNKDRDMHIKIYDARENVVFDCDDIKIQVLHEKDGVLHCIENSKEMVKKEIAKPYTKPYHSYTTQKTKSKKKTSYKESLYDGDYDDGRFMRDYF